VGCGIIVHTKDGKWSTPKVILIIRSMRDALPEGCVDHAAGEQSDTRPEADVPGAGRRRWKEVEWDWALDQIAKNVKETRDRTFKLTSKSKVKEKQPDGTDKEIEKEFTVNRTDAIAHVGSAASTTRNATCSRR